MSDILSDDVFYTDDLLVLSGKEIAEIINLAAEYTDKVEDARCRVRKLAVKLKDLDGWGYCEDCGGRRYRP